MPLESVFNIVNEYTSKKPKIRSGKYCAREPSSVWRIIRPYRHDGTEIAIEDSAAPIRTANG